MGLPEPFPDGERVDALITVDPLILSLASQDREGACALFKGDALLSSRVFPAEPRLSEAIWGELDALLQACGQTLKDIDGFAALRGPGSYTSLRVILAAINGLAWALDRPVWGFCRDELGEVADDSTVALAIKTAQLAVRAETQAKDSTVLKYQGPISPDYSVGIRIR